VVCSGAPAADRLNRVCVLRQKEEQLKKESILRHKKEYMMMRQRSELNHLMQSERGEHHINFDVGCFLLSAF